MRNEVYRCAVRNVKRERNHCTIHGIVSEPGQQRSFCSRKGAYYDQLEF